MNQADDILVALDAFIRKYYKNQLLRGVLYAVGIVATIYLAAVLLEHFGWLSPVGRGLLFWGGLAAVVAVSAWLIVRPLLKMLGLGKRISHAEAARIVGRHFPEVSDKLLNLLQLMDSSEAGGRSSEVGGRRSEVGSAPQSGAEGLGSAPTSALRPPTSDLVLAAIEQKTAQLRPVPMLSAINLGANRRYLKYALPPLAVLAVLLLAAPQVVTEPSRRIAHYSTVYERPAPFRFEVEQQSLWVSRGGDYQMDVSVSGEALPAEAFVVVEGRRYRMERLSPTRFSYTFRHVVRPLDFALEGGGVVSDGWRLNVWAEPEIVEFRMVLSYPAYTGRESEVLVNQGDAAVPEGTQVKWIFQTREVEHMGFLADSGRRQWQLQPVAGRLEHSLRVGRSMDYGFYAVSTQAIVSDTLRYALSAIADAAPMIVVEEVQDSLHPDRRLFRGRVKDDYGFSRLVFRRRTVNRQDTARNELSEAEIALHEGEASQEFFFSFNTAALVLALGDELGYWFEVSDNDAIHGPKTTSSQVFEIKIPTADELDSLLSQSQSDVRQSADEQMHELRQLQEEINEMMRRLVDKKELDWQDRKDLEQIKQKQRQVRNMMEQMQQQIQENNRMEQRFREQSEQLMEKQRELDRLMNEVMDEKMKETMAEIERLMKELDKGKVQQELEQLKMDNADLEQQLDQNIELMKRLEIEKRVEQTIQKMDRLAAEQRQAAEQTEQAPAREREQLQERQQELNDRFRQLKQDIDQIRQDYKELDPSTDFRVPTELEQQVEQKQEAAGQQLQRGKQKDASQMQREAADDMEKLSEALAEAQLDAEQQDLAEDAAVVRQLLKNLVQLSFNQEELVDDLRAIYIQDPRYQTIITRQNRIKDDFRNVDDSLRAMARRQLQVASAISKNLAEVNSSTARSLTALLDMNQSFYGSYKNTQAASSMQYGMTALNNLALVLAESLDQMQSQMRQNAQKKKSGQCKNPGKSSSQCSNPGKGKPSPKSMRQMQQELNRQMEALKKQLDKQGNKPNGRHQLGQGQQMSQELARMAAQQEMIRRMMQQYGQEMKSASGGDPKLAREIDQMMRQMEQTETDLVNRTITRQTIQRQQQIMTRLLEHERAEMQREKEERRESREADDLYSQPSPAELERYQQQLKPAQDQLRTVPPTLAPYYRQKVDDYFYRR